MSDNSYNQPNGAQGTANSGVSAGNVSGSQEQNGSEAFITKAEFEELKRQMQSQTDKAIHSSIESRLKQARAEADKAVQTSKAAGIEITPEQERAILQELTNKVLYAEEPVASRQGQGQSNGDDYAWITDAADDIMEEYDVDLSVRELKQIQSANPAEYLKQVRAMAKQKSAGQGRAPQQPTPNNTPPDARTFFGSNVGGVPTPQTQDTLRDSYLKEINDFKAANPRATVDQLFDIREKWLSKGWNGVK
jgi:hypothetical protein